MATRYGSLTLQIKALSNLADIGSPYTDTLISASGSQELSKVGRGSFTVSARAYALLTAVTSNIGQVAYVYITDQVASAAAMDVCSFIIQDIDLSTTDNGAMVTVSGPDLLHQLTYTTLDSNVIDDGAGGPSTTDIADIMAYAAAGWSTTGGNSTNGTYHVSSGNNVLEILIAATKQSGGMFRLSAYSPPAKTVAWRNAADSSGITLRMPESPIAYDASTSAGIILSMSENNSISQVVTRVKPHGAGLSDGRLNIRNIDSGDTGGDPAGYTTYFNTTFPNTIVNDTLETALGYIIKQDVDFSHIRAADPTNATELTTAAVALWNEGITFLQERDSSNKVYDVECVVPYDLRPGQTVTIVYTEYEGGITGGNAVWSVNAAFTIHQVSNSVGNSGDLAGVRVTRLSVGETTVPRPSGSSQMAAAARTARETTRKADPTTAPTSVPQSRLVSTALPLTGGGDMSADRTHSLGTLSSYGSANQVLGANAAANNIEYKTITAGTGISVGHTAGAVTITNTDTGSGLSALPFVTIGNTASLSAERALTAGDGIDLTDGGANSTATLSVDVTDILGNGFTESSNNIVLGTPGSSTASSTNAVTTSSHTHAIDTTIARSAVTVTAGAGLTGGGDLTTNRTIAVATADTSMTINADSIQVRLAATSGLQISTGLMIADTVAGAGLTIASKVLAVGVSGLGLSTTADAVVLASSSNPGAAASILATDASGFLTLRQLTIANDNAVYLRNAAGTANAGELKANASDQVALTSHEAGNALYLVARNIADTGYLQAALLDAGTGTINFWFDHDANITSSGWINLQPNAGDDLLVNLSTTGDFIVNTDDLVVDTSTGFTGYGTASPDSKNHIYDGKLRIEHSSDAVQMLFTDASDDDTYGFRFQRAANTFLIVGAAANRTPNETTAIATFYRGGGMQVGSPTGGDKGAGTINAQAVYDDNTLLTDYVFEPDYNLLPINQMTRFYRDNLHLPTIPGRDTWNKKGGFSLGELATHLWETVEVQARYITELHERLEAIGG